MWHPYVYRLCTIIGLHMRDSVRSKVSSSLASYKSPECFVCIQLVAVWLPKRLSSLSLELASV